MASNTPLASANKASRRPPARVHRILKVLRCRKAGMPIADVPWQAYRFHNKDFDELQAWLKKDEELWGYVEDKVRYDYDSERGCLVSRRPTVLHSSFISFVAQEINQCLYAIANGDDPVASAFAKTIHPMGSARVDLLGTEDKEGEAKMRRDPDFSFRLFGAAWPGIILELSYPSKKRALPYLADDYILETSGEVRVLVGLYLDSETKKATISTWQPLFKENNHGVVTELEAALVRDDELFRDKYGNANQDPKSGLHLDLKDFGPKHMSMHLASEIPVSVSSATLCVCLARAEAAQKNDIDRRNGMSFQPKGMIIKKRRRAQMESDGDVSGDVAAGYDKFTSTESVAKKEKFIAKVENRTSDNEEVQISDVISRKGSPFHDDTFPEILISKQEDMSDMTESLDLA